MWLPAEQHAFNTKTFVDILAIDKILEYIKPEYSCEIGIFHGDTLQVIDRHSKKTFAIDIRFRKELHKRNFNNVEFIHADKKYQKNDIFDFIHIDGDHSYESCLQDLLYCLDHTTEESIIVVDDYFNKKFTGVKKATDQFIKQSDFQTSLIGHNQIFLQNKFAEKNLQDIIESKFSKNLKKFCCFDAELKSYSDKTGQLDFKSKLALLEHYL